MQKNPSDTSMYREFVDSITSDALTSAPSFYLVKCHVHFTSWRSSQLIDKMLAEVNVVLGERDLAGDLTTVWRAYACLANVLFDSPEAACL